MHASRGMRQQERRALDEPELPTGCLSSGRTWWERAFWMKMTPEETGMEAPPKERLLCAQARDQRGELRMSPQRQEEGNALWKGHAELETPRLAPGSGAVGHLPCWQASRSQS